jgi:hypothetical protein
VAKERVNCKTQTECDAALEAKKIPVLVGDGWFKIQGTQYVEARESSHVEARESSHVEARESSHVVAWESSHVEAWGSSHVEARGSSHVEAWGSSHVEARGSSHVVAWESSHVVAWGSSHVVATPQVAIHQHSADAKVKGGVVIVVKMPKTPLEWCEFYGAKIEDNHAILFKGVNDNFKSPRGGDYTPGTMPEAPDRDLPEYRGQECGGGLHFSPHPPMTFEYNSSATKFVACPVKLEDIFVHPEAEMPNKVKAPRVSLPCYEVDRYGKKI